MRESRNEQEYELAIVAQSVPSWQDAAPVRDRSWIGRDESCTPLVYVLCIAVLALAGWVIYSSIMVN